MRHVPEPKTATGQASFPGATLEVLTPGGASRYVTVTGSPFEIGRGGEGKDRLAFADARVSRRAGMIVYENGEFLLRDLGQRHGLFLNGQPVGDGTPMRDGDVIGFGNTDAVQIVFRTASGRESITSLLSRLDESAGHDAADQNLHQLSLLLEATALLQTQMPFEEVLGAMVDQAITITAADRGALLEADPQGGLAPLVARKAGGMNVALGSWAPSRTAIDQALRDGRAFVEQDMSLAGDSLKTAASIVDQQLQSVMAIPLYSRIRTAEPASAAVGALLGLLYLDSRHPAAFRGLGRQVLDALAIEAASVIDNARMVERERQRRQMEQDLSIARGIQQRLVPREFRRYGFIEITGVNQSCHSVGGDYFDLVELEPGRVAFVIADVAGKGLAAALLTAMLQGGFAGITLTPDPTRLVSHLNRYVWGRSEPNRFATAFIGVLDRTGRLTYINAGHLPGLLIRGSDLIAKLGSRSFPIGMFHDAVFAPDESVLLPGDTLVMFTDGINEATNTQGEEFGMDRLAGIVREAGPAPVEDIRNAVMSAVSRFTLGEEPADDMTLLIVRYAGAAAGLPDAKAPASVESGAPGIREPGA